MTDLDLSTALDELHAAIVRLGWFVGLQDSAMVALWAIYAFDPQEKSHIGKRSREWTVVGQMEEECVLEMARCLRELGEGLVKSKRQS